MRRTSLTHHRLVRAGTAILALLCTTACQAQTLREARENRSTGTVRQLRQPANAPIPPDGVLDVVRYPSPVGSITGYLTPLPRDGRKHPAIIWISGGDLALGDFWTRQPRSNDQSAAAFRDASLIVFYPSLRGLNGNPGTIEGFYGELDDLVAATRWLKSQPGVDPDRVYLGGHSTGGSLVLLAAAYASEWRSVFAFGPVYDVRSYGDAGLLPIAPDDLQSATLRAPGLWLGSVTRPTYVIEGTGRGNITELERMRRENSNPAVHFLAAGGCDHFSVLRPGSEAIAAMLTADDLTPLDRADAFSSLCANQ